MVPSRNASFIPNATFRMIPDIGLLASMKLFEEIISNSSTKFGLQSLMEYPL